MSRERNLVVGMEDDSPPPLARLSPSKSLTDIQASVSHEKKFFSYDPLPRFTTDLPFVFFCAFSNFISYIFYYYSISAKKKNLQRRRRSIKRKLKVQRMENIKKKGIDLQLCSRNQLM